MEWTGDEESLCKYKNSVILKIIAVLSTGVNVQWNPSKPTPLK